MILPFPCSLKNPNLNYGAARDLYCPGALLAAVADPADFGVDR